MELFSNNERVTLFVSLPANLAELLSRADVRAWDEEIRRC
jgi:hypothetical protein